MHHWHPHFNHGLTIGANPDPITAGEGVLIYGQLKGPDSAYKRVYLFHRINPASRFTIVGVRRTNAQGFYEFVRADGVVVSNRNWYVVGPYDTHSRTIHELVSAVLTLNASSTSGTTAQPVTFTGTVTPITFTSECCCRSRTAALGQRLDHDRQRIHQRCIRLHDHAPLQVGRQLHAARLLPR